MHTIFFSFLVFLFAFQSSYHLIVLCHRLSNKCFWVDFWSAFLSTNCKNVLFRFAFFLSSLYLFFFISNSTMVFNSFLFSLFVSKFTIFRLHYIMCVHNRRKGAYHSCKFLHASGKSFELFFYKRFCICFFVFSSSFI